MGDPLRAFLSGKRTAKRHALALPALIHGRSVQIAAETVDVSANGVQVSVDVHEALPGVTGAIEVAAFNWLRNGFPDGMHIVMLGRRVVVHADPVRTTIDPDDPDKMFIGCRLREELSDEEIRRLGLRPEACGAENAVTDEPPAHDNTSHLEPERSMSIRVLRNESDETPLFAGEVIGISDNSLTILVPNAKPRDIFSKLDCLELYFDVEQDGLIVWASKAAVTALPMPTDQGVELGLWSDTSPRRPLVCG